MSLVVVLVTFLLLSGLMDLLSGLAGRGQRRVRDRLGAAIPSDFGPPADVRRRQSLSEVPWLNRFLARKAWARRLDLVIRQGRSPGASGVYVLLSGLLFLAAYYPVQAFFGPCLAALGAGLAAGAAPFVWLKRRKTKRMAAFERQLPEALDLMARALKAGHTFGGGMRMAADEYGDPLGPEFAATLDEINFGVDVGRAMENLVARVDCPDLKYFTVSVNIQRETGGNLAEIVGNIAQLIRERFRLQGRVRVLSAEGRLSAVILLALPFVVALALYLINAEYMRPLTQTAIGRGLLGSALASMSLGALAIKRLIKIKV
ncbi:MAG: type II secretion system F family protein [Desulfovibrionaceae bacterium]|nr:type II secretion system F family protein [Desulfovibrionaceae bacterium]